MIFGTLGQRRFGPSNFKVQSLSCKLLSWAGLKNSLSTRLAAIMAVSCCTAHKMATETAKTDASNYRPNLQLFCRLYLWVLDCLPRDVGRAGLGHNKVRRYHGQT